MPKLSDSMADAVIVRWLKSPGEAFTRGEALLEVETDKATVVYEAETDGTLDDILVPEGGTAAVGRRRSRHWRGAGPARRRTAGRRPVAADAAERNAGRAPHARSSSASRFTASRAPGPAAGSGGRTSSGRLCRPHRRTARQHRPAGARRRASVSSRRRRRRRSRAGWPSRRRRSRASPSPSTLDMSRDRRSSASARARVATPCRR